MSARFSRLVRIPGVTLVVTLFLALSGMVVSYAFGQGGPVAGLVFLGILLVGSLIKITQPLRERLRP
jgi:prepilin signal peptidase PulO-like enzyme (type II secretory pathway)